MIFEYSISRFNYRISIRLCDLFSKGVPGLDNIKTVRWREGRSDLSLARSGHCSVIPNLYHLHVFLSLVCLKM